MTESDVQHALEGLPIPDGVESFWKTELAAPSGTPLTLQPGALKNVDHSLTAIDEPGLFGHREVARTGIEPPAVTAAENDDSEGVIDVDREIETSSAVLEAEIDEVELDSADAVEADVSDAHGGFRGPGAVAIVSGDQMTAWLVADSLNFNWPLEEREARDALDSAGIHGGVDEDALQRALGEPLLVPIEIAGGKRPKLPENGRPVFQFDAGVLDELEPAESTVQDESHTAEGSPEVQTEQGEPAEPGAIEVESDPGGLQDDYDRTTIDWYEQFARETVGEGQVPVRALPPVPGTAGMTVTGSEIPVPNGAPFEISVLAGENTEVRDDTLVATIAGEPVYKDGKVRVIEALVIGDDVDFSTGNIRFPGSVDIKGNVHPGFNVRAGENIEVGGEVAGGMLEAAGDGLIGQGFLGEAEGMSGSLKIGGDLKLRFINGGFVVAGGDLLVADEIVRGEVGVIGSIKVEGRGRIVGGRVSAQVEISAKSVGSPAGTRTMVMVGRESAGKRSIGVLVNTGLVLEEDLIGDSSDDAETTGGEPSEKTGSHEANEGTGATNDAQDDTTDDESDVEREPQLVVSDWIYPGTIVAIGDSVTHVDAKLARCMLKEENGTIRTFSL